MTVSHCRYGNCQLVPGLPLISKKKQKAFLFLPPSELLVVPPFGRTSPEAAREYAKCNLQTLTSSGKEEGIDGPLWNWKDWINK